ncbi:hypothetical protein AAHA92_03059 [Salvia divinorum]|uniref:Uncharacterized protein n=1 Tax=Salvia divinorum TaxID=28513 RepID=A0ABD1IK07_SALDI
MCSRQSPWSGDEAGCVQAPLCLYLLEASSLPAPYQRSCGVAAVTGRMVAKIAPVVPLSASLYPPCLRMNLAFCGCPNIKMRRRDPAPNLPS